MKKQNRAVLKKTISSSLGFAILLATVSGCNSSSKAVESTTKGATATSATSGATKISVALQAQPNVENFETNYYTQMVEKNMNVKFEFLQLPNKGDEAKTKIALMVSSGTTLPDVINGVLDDVAAYDYAAKGVFVKLDDYYKNPATSPNFNNIPEKDFIYKNLKLANGSVYSLPKYTPFAWNEGPYRFWMNSQWMEKLNLKAPTTTDELYTVLKAFVEKDPNGNGKKDEIGIIGSKDGWAQDPMVYLMNSFLYANPDKNYLDVKDGKIISSFTQPEWKQGLEYMNKLVKEGLLSPLTFTQDGTQLKALINVKGGMAGAVASGSYSTFSANELENKMDLLGPVKGPNGVAFTPQNPTLPGNFWFITKDCKNTELAFKVGDYMLDPTVSKVSRFGEQGVDWSEDPTIAAQYLGELEESSGIKTKLAIINPKVWGNPQNKNWQEATPCYRSLSDASRNSALKKTDVNPNASPNFQPAYAKYYTPAFPKDVITKLSYTPEELKKIANSKTAIDTYVKDTAVAFITGNKSLSEWDSYIAELNKMGLTNYIAAAQAAYDRTK
jgi:putative aldouronate transport system substrate-binding protein